jgi:hypothetical protein
MFLDVLGTAIITHNILLNCSKTFTVTLYNWLSNVFFFFKWNTRWFKYDRDDLCVNKSQFVPVIFEPPCKLSSHTFKEKKKKKSYVFVTSSCVASFIPGHLVTTDWWQRLWTTHVHTETTQNSNVQGIHHWNTACMVEHMIHNCTPHDSHWWCSCILKFFSVAKVQRILNQY